jgi:hypothetical protein
LLSLPLFLRDSSILDHPDAKVPNKASCAWEPNLINFPILGKKMVKIEKLGNQKA